MNIIAVIVKEENLPDLPKSCPECLFMTEDGCLPQGENSTILWTLRPDVCPLMSARQYAERGKQ